MCDGQPELPTHSPERVLLLVPPVYDTRFHWSKWQQPTSLLRLAKHFRSYRSDVRLVDALYRRTSETLHRERVARLDVDGIMVPKWRYGAPEGAILKQLRSLAEANWSPDEVYVDCFTTFWWEGAAEVIRTVKQVFPQSRVILTGAYPSIAPQHAAENTLADERQAEPWHGLYTLAADLSVYPVPPAFSYLTLGHGTRRAEDVVTEIKEATEIGVKQFVFAEESIASQYFELYASILSQVAASNLKVKFYALGNIAPSDLVAHPELAELMKAAGYAQIWLSDDRNLPVTLSPNEQLIEELHLSAVLCREAGFKERADEVIAAVCLGKPGESLSERVQLATYAAHHIGSVIFWAYQPKLEECPHLPLERQNGKLYPLRRVNEYSYRDYLNVMGLATVLNSKHRTNTFDFMGEGLVSTLFRNSLQRRAWEPDPAVKGSIQLPMRIGK